MTRQQWRLRVTGKQRKEVDINLLIAAIIALGEQLQAEQREQALLSADDPSTPPRKEKTS